MKTKRVLRYYCDHCKKGSFAKSSMLKHEVSCTMNPDRKCSLCTEHHLEPEPFEKLIEICNGFPIGEKEQETHLNNLRAAADGCPVCMLAAMRRCDNTRIDPYSDEDCKIWFYFNFKEEMKEFWSDIRNQQADFAPSEVHWMV